MTDSHQEAGNDEHFIRTFCGADDTASEAAAISLGEAGAQGLRMLSRLMMSAREDVRFWAVRGLWVNGSEAATALIVAALQDGAEMVRNGAAMALGELATAQAVVPLAELLRREPASSGTYAAEALVKIGRPSGPLLVDALKQDSAEVRTIAAKALGALEYRQAIGPLIEALDDESYLVVHYAQEALARMGVGQMVYFSSG